MNDLAVEWGVVGGQWRMASGVGGGRGVGVGGGVGWLGQRPATTERETGHDGEGDRAQRKPTCCAGPLRPRAPIW